MKPNKLYEAMVEAIYADGITPDEINKMATKIYKEKNNQLKETRDKLIENILEYVYMLCPDQELTDEDIDKLVEEFINFEKILAMVSNK